VVLVILCCVGCIKCCRRRKANKNVDASMDGNEETAGLAGADGVSRSSEAGAHLTVGGDTADVMHGGGM
jgi:hypothetical protein